MRILITGASGQLGAYLLRELHHQAELVAWSGSRHDGVLGASLQPVDLTDCHAVATAFRAAHPDVVIHTAALARIADCYREPHRAQQINVTATGVLAEQCVRSRTRLVFVSTDLVFDGERGSYREHDSPSPLSVYGRTKRDAEEAVRAVPQSVVARLSLLYGPSRNGCSSFFDEQTTALKSSHPLKLFTDEWRTPLDLATAARALSALAVSDITGTLHIGGPERLSRYEMGVRLAAALGADPSAIVAVTRSEAPAAEPRPRDTSLDSSRWRVAFPALPWPRYLENA